MKIKELLKTYLPVYIDNVDNNIVQSIYFKSNIKLFKNFIESIPEEITENFNLFKYHIALSETTRPFDPFFEIINEILEKYDIDIDEIIHDIDIYPYHKDLIMNYILKTDYYFDDELIYDELEYDKLHIQKSIYNILIYLSKFKPIIIAIGNMQNFTKSNLEFIKNIETFNESGKILFLYSFDKFLQFASAEKNDIWNTYQSDFENYSTVFEIDDVSNAKISLWKQTYTPISIKQIINEAQSNFNFFCYYEANSCANKAYKISQESNKSLKKSEYYKLLKLLGESYYYLGENDNALIFYHMLLDLSEKNQEKFYICETYRSMALVQINKNDLDEAQRLCHQSIKFAKNINDEFSLLKSYYTLSIVYDLIVSNLDNDTYEYLIGKLKDFNLNKMYAHTLKNAYLYLDYYKSIDVIEKVSDEAIEISRKNNNEFGLAVGYHKKGIIYSYKGDYESSLQYLKMSEQIRYKLKQPLEIIRINNGIGFLYTIIEDYENAFIYFNKSIKEIHKIRNYNEILLTLYNLGFLYFIVRDYEKSILFFDKILYIMSILKISNIPFRSTTDIYILKALCHYKNKQIIKALELLSRFNSIQKEINNESHFFLNILLGNMASDNKDFDKADAHFKKAKYSLDSKIDVHKTYLPFYYIEYSLMFECFDNDDESKKKLTKALEISKSLNLNKHINWINNYFVSKDKSRKIFNVDNIIIDFDTIIEFARQQVVLNKLHKKISDIEFLNSTQSLINLSSNKKEIADKFLELIHAHFPVEINSIHLYDNDNWDCISSNINDLFFEKDILELIKQIRLKGDKVLLNLNLERENYKNLKLDLTNIINISFKNNDKFYGNLFLATENPDVILTVDDLNILSIAANQIVSIFERLDYNYKLLELSNTDSITGLYNNKAFKEKIFEEVQRAKRYRLNIEKSLTIVYINLNNFNYYNETFGREISDFILQLFSSILINELRETDFISRVGGNEFSIIMPETSSEQAKIVIERILDSFNKTESFKIQLEKKMGIQVFINKSRILSFSTDIITFDNDEIHKSNDKDFIKELIKYSMSRIGKGE